MVCHYHPDREATDSCAICGKSICKECGLEIAGKIYCKDCLEKIVGIGIQSTASNQNTADSIATEPAASTNKVDETIYQPQDDYGSSSYAQDEALYTQEPKFENQNKAISDDSPYNIKDNINYSGGLESSYLSESESNYESQISRQPQVTPNEIQYSAEEITQQPVAEQEYIYPDHNYEPQPTSARRELENKYEKYLDDLYFDETDVPLNEQLAKDEEQYGSLTRRPYEPKENPIEKAPQTSPRHETPEEMEARIRAEIAREMKGGKKESIKEDKSIHNIDYGDEKESMGVVDILLTIILIIVILIVIYYIIYLFLLNTSYPTFMDALFGLTTPQNVINNLLNH